MSNSKTSNKIKGIELAWIVVSDLAKAKKFFTDIGLKLTESNDECGWLELEGHEGGTKLGVGVKAPENPITPGQNAIVTFTVENIEKTVEELSKKGVNLVGSILEVPGAVKLQLFTDPDGNKFQVVQHI